MIANDRARVTKAVDEDILCELVGRRAGRSSVGRQVCSLSIVELVFASRK